MASEKEILAFEHEKISKLLLRYALPAVIANLSTALYNIVDRAIIGQNIGAEAISGLALTFPIMTILQAFGTLVGVGAASKISIVLGMKDKPRAEKIFGTSIALTIFIWACIFLSSIFFLEPFLRLFGGSNTTIPYATSYLGIIIPFSIFQNFAYSYNNVIRSLGEPKTSMKLMLFSIFCNIVLDIVFIKIFGWGIKGAAWATVVSMLITAIFTMRLFFLGKTYIGLNFKNIRLKWIHAKDIVSIGLSPFLMNLAACLVNAVLNDRLYQSGGDLAIGAYGIINSYSVLFILGIAGLCQGMQPIAGYNYGAKNKERLKKVLFLCLSIAFCISFSAFVICQCFPLQMASLFTNDPKLLGLTERGMRLTFAAFAPICFQVCAVNYFQSIGKVGCSIFISQTRQLLFLIPSMYVCSAIWGLDGVWYATPIADCFGIVAGGNLLFFHIRELKK